MSIKKYLSFSLLISLLTLVFLSKPTLAASALDLKIYPPVAYLSVKPGAGINHLVKLSNQGLYTLEITPTLVNFQTDGKSGAVILEQSSDFTYLNLEADPANWGKSFILKPGEEKNLNFVIALPSLVPEKEFHLSILFQARQVAQGSSHQQQAILSAIVASNVVLAVSNEGQNRGELVIEQFNVPKLADSLIGFSFSALLKNIGSNATPITGQIKISHWPAAQAEIYQLYPDMVLAGSQRLARTMSEEDLKSLTQLEESKAVLAANGEDYAARKAQLIREKLSSQVFYKKSFLLGAYDLELTVGEQKSSKRVIVLPFSLLLIVLILPILYALFSLVQKLTQKVIFKKTDN